MASQPPSDCSLPLYAIGDDAIAVTLHEPASKRSAVPETLVQHLWAEQRFDRSGLHTTTGAPVVVHAPGTPNTDSGPDFIDARIDIDGTTWRGAVEIHTTSADWFAHRHHKDARYNSVVLHVTLHPDTWTGGLLRADQTLLPEIVLSPRLQRPLRRLLHRFHTQTDTDVLCAPLWDRVPEPVRAAWIDELASTRLRAKAKRLGERFQTYPVWDQLLYERLFAGLGYAKNDTAMETLARRLPLRLLRVIADPLDREAVAFGVAGLLPAPGDLLDSDRATADYVMDLRTRFRRLQTHHDVPTMERTQWTFFRLRPANFPPLRLAQGLAWLRDGALLHTDPTGRLLQALRSDAALDTLRSLLNAHPHAFWNTHLRLAKATKPRDPSLGRTRTDTLIVNAVLPLMLLVADHRTAPDVEQRVIDVLRDLPAPRDSVTRTFRTLGTRPASAFEAQGLHELYRSYCRSGRCLSCAIGQHVLNR
jgi:hypothetical protein